MPASRIAWKTWFTAWFAAHWTRADLPGLRIVVLLHDAIERGEHQRSAEFRLWCDTYGITPKGAADRRWERPTEVAPLIQPRPSKPTDYQHLLVVE
jgi:hypothetical protein